MVNSLIDFSSTLMVRVRQSEGQTMAEYGILIAVIALVVIVAAITLGRSISTLFNSTAGQI